MQTSVDIDKSLTSTGPNYIPVTMMSELDTEILMILTVMVNRQKHELMNEQDQRQIGYTSRIVIDCKEKQRKADVADVTIEKGDRCIVLHGVVKQ